MNYKDIGQSDRLDSYLCAVGMPIENYYVIGCAFEFEVNTLRAHLEYFETVRSVIGLLQRKLRNAKTVRSFKGSPLPEKLSQRQETILSLIREGRTNAVIALLLGFSESVIKQEAMAIYRILGVSGRKDLIGKGEHA